jgi:hypothetical protein
MPEWHEILKYLAGFLTGFCFKWVLVWRSNRTTVRQDKNVVGGNMAGRDVNVENRRR